MERDTVYVDIHVEEIEARGLVLYTYCLSWGGADSQRGVNNVFPYSSDGP